MTADPSRDAEALGNRVRKNVKHLGKWAKREGVTCFRVYDRDIPEVPVTLERYEDKAVLHDVRTPYDDRDEALAAAWLDAVAAAAAGALDLPPGDLFVKRRERMTGGRQYERLGERGAWHEVGEGGHRFVVNLSDYLDTGLFLDHRITRARVSAEAAGKRVLNLFCYTASFTVYAAAGGATSSLSIDLSKTYLDWAADNFARNRIDRKRHDLLHGDVREALDDLAGGTTRYDLAIVDPPTFSRSKRMEGTFDILRDHPSLLAQVGRLMAPGGVIWFSTNHHRFKLALPARFAPTWKVSDETRATIPPDFRDAKIHQAWRISV